MTAVPSFTFAGGEISEALWGRVDLQKYQTGVKRGKNVHVAVEGGLTKRIGQYFVGYPKYQDKISRFVPWRIANDDSYVLEFGEEYIRFIRLGGYVEYPGGHTPDPDSDAIDVDGFLEVPTTYTEDEVKALKFTFANDIVYIFHRNHPPAQLQRLDLYDWSLVDTEFNPHPDPPANVEADYQKYAGTTLGLWETTNDTNIIDGYAETWKPYKYKVSAVMENTGIESLPSAFAEELGDLGHQRLSILVTWDAVAGAEKYHIYKGSSGLYGWIGTIYADETLEFRDTNFAPSYDIVPVKDFPGFDPVTETVQYPGVGEFYKQRLVYAGTHLDPQRMWFSRPLFFNALTTSEPSQADDAIIIKLVGNERHSIQHMVQMKKFVVFTDSAEWIIGTGNNEALASDTIDPVIETSYSSDPFLSPLPIGDRILFVQNLTRVILDMGYDFGTDAYKADDLTRLSRHLFDNKNIISWDYSLFPGSLVWTVTDDGYLQSMTYSRDHEIWGWTWHETVGDYIDVACVPEFNQFATYYQVRRTINGVSTLFTERAEVLFTDRVEEMFYVDCGISYNPETPYTDGTRLSATSFQFTQTDHGLAVDDEVLIENEAFRTRTFVTAVDGDDVTVEPKYDDQPFADVDSGLFAEGNFFLCVDALSGFDHLAGHSTDLIALADGNVIEDIEVDLDGEVQLPSKFARVHIGFRYEGEIISLNMDPQQLMGRYHLKSVGSLKLRVKDSRGILAGPSDSDHEPTPLKPRSDEDLDQPNRMLSGVYEVNNYSEWDLEAGVRILLPYPLPAHIQNIIPDMEYEG